MQTMCFYWALGPWGPNEASWNLAQPLLTARHSPYRLTPDMPCLFKLWPCSTHTVASRAVGPFSFPLYLPFYWSACLSMGKAEQCGTRLWRSRGNDNQQWKWDESATPQPWEGSRHWVSAARDKEGFLKLKETMWIWVYYIGRRMWWAEVSWGGVCVLKWVWLLSSVLHCIGLC